MIPIITERCSRCRNPIAPGERWAPDPCCSAPDCPDLNAVSHYRCLPRVFQIMEDEMEAESRMFTE